MNTYICRYCRQPSDPGSPTCPLCGAPVDIRSVVSDSGWVEQPPIRDMARLQLGQSHCQIAGTTVPAAEFTLAPEDWIYFSHHVLLWTEPQTRLTNMPMKGAWNRKMAGLPLIMVDGEQGDEIDALGRPAQCSTSVCTARSRIPHRRTLLIRRSSSVARLRPLEV